MRIALATLSFLTALCLVTSPSLRAADDEADLTRKVGRLEVVVGDDGNVTSATLICEGKDEWDDVVKYTLILNDKTRKQATELKDKKVLVMGILKVNEDDIIDSIRVSSITEAKDEAEKPAEPAKPAEDNKANDDLF